MHARSLALFALAAMLAFPAAAPPAHTKPIPGGAMQAKGVSGTLKSTLFNGEVRVRKMSLGKPAGPPNEDYQDTSDSVYIVYHALMSNGSSKVLDMQQFSASIEDADGIAVAAAPDRLLPMGSINNIPPGGAWKESIVFSLPRTFVPVKIVLVPVADAHKAFRIDLKPGDLPNS